MEPIKWTKLIDLDIDFTVLTKVAPTKGNITYEYNPFYNYRINQNMYEYKEGLYSLADLWNNFKITLRCEIKPYKKIINEDNTEDKEYLLEPEQYDTSDLKYYDITTATQFTDYTKTANIIVCAFKEGRNADRLNLEKALKESSGIFEAVLNQITEGIEEETEEETEEIQLPYYVSGDWVSFNDNLSINTSPVLREAGELTDFITDELSFDLEHPVLMLPLYSYDGSVNLILNDGKNTPKLINSRFSSTGKNTYEVCDRKGNNDTNIYDLGDAFELDTSLYKQTSSIALLSFEGVQYGGALKVGNYHFYFKVADADGNESDFIAESGLVSVFLGSNSYSSVSTGERDLDSHKLVQFLLSNLDTSYDYVHVYYSRYTAENNLNRTIEYLKIEKNYPINNARLSNIIITGYEQHTSVTAEDINLQFNIVDSAYTSAICLNRLFMANVHKPDIPYIELLDLSLRILPYLNTELYTGTVDQNYFFHSSNRGYIDPKYIYEKTGYWTGELYRFGIVYIMKDNTLSPVFNIRGGCRVGREKELEYYSKIPIYDDDKKRIYITSDEESYKLIKEEYKITDTTKTSIGSCQYENVKGVVQFECQEDTDIVYSVNMVIPYEVKTELSKYVKGYFFVRLPRIPFVLAQGITIGINKESGTPTIPTANGVVDEIALIDLSKTHVCVGDDNDGKSSINGMVYLSEGFLSRYKFKYKVKSSTIWKKIGMAMAIAVGVAAVAAAIVFAPELGIPAAAFLTKVAGAVGVTAGAVSAATAVGIGGAVMAAGTVVAAGAITAITAGTQDLIYLLQSIRHKSYNRWNSEVPKGYKIVELDNSRKLTLDYIERVVLTATDENYVAGILCPDFELDLPHFNSIFIADEHLIEPTITLSLNLSNEYGDNYFTNDGGRHFYMPSYADYPKLPMLTAKVIGLTDNQKVGVIEDLKFRARAGEAEEAWRVESVGSSFRSTESIETNVEDDETIDHRKINSDIVRGSFGPFLGFYDKSSQLLAGTTVNIYTAGYDASKIENYVYQRACDASTFYTISDRYELTSDTPMIFGILDTSDTSHIVYRGDCYLCQFTHRMNRNFQDPNALFNDEIVEENTWRDNYDPGNQENLDKINAGDVNAILLGTWVTFRVRSSNNLNIRTEDMSYVDENAMTNHPRTYYPKTPMSVEGVYKTPESSVFNAGFKKLLGERYNFEVPDVPWIKNWYGTRIMYSDINVSDSFLNGFRVFRGQNYRDYTREYGEITKLISLNSNLLCVFEHGVALIPVNERTVAGEGAGGFAYINTSNVLPENPKILSDVYGSQWADSILKVPGKFGDNVLYVYGVDTVAKKIWRTDGNTLTCISDRKVLEFLNNNITLSEFELTPKIGIRNVKTFYNAFKRDVMFTFYDNTYGFEEKVWNLCWNELMDTFVTFYSWVPSVMENINNIPFSFNRNTSKWIAKLGTSHSNSSFADGVTLTNVVISNNPDEDGGYTEDYNIPYTYTTVDGDDFSLNLKVRLESKPNLVGVLSLSNRILPELEGIPQINFSLERDPWHNYEIFKIESIKVDCDEFSNLTDGSTDINGIKHTSGNFVLPNWSNTTFPLAKYAGEVTFYGLYFNNTIEWKRKEYLNTLKELNNLTQQLSKELKNLLKDIEDGKVREFYDAYDIMSEIYYRNSANIAHADSEYIIKEDEDGEKIVIQHKIGINDEDEYGISIYDPKKNYFIDCVNNLYPIFKDSKGYRPNLEEPHNKDLIVRLINVKATIKYQFKEEGQPLGDDYYNIAAGYEPGTSLIDAGYYLSTIAVIPKWNLSLLSTDFWKHGLAGIFDIADKIYPTYWYGEQHPFEFEFIVANDPGKHKIFDNLQIISNKAEPLSFHYEVVGECYEFAKDKKNMYIRQEATKELYQYNGSDITYNHDYDELEEKRRNIQTGIEMDASDLRVGNIYDKSTLFPLYYGRLDHINEIYDSYKLKNGTPEGKDYSWLSGAELILYNNLNEIRIRNNCKAINIDNKQEGNLLRGNMIYKEDLWDVLINTLNFVQKNEDDWSKTLRGGKSTQIPVEINTFAIPEDIKGIQSLTLPPDSKTFKERGAVIWDKNKVWKEAKIKDKYLKVRIRYSGKDLAVINAINTLYTISYS